MPRALIVTHSYYLRDTRPRRHAQALAAAGWDVEVLCARDEGESVTERASGILIRRLPARRRRGSKFRYIYEYLSFAALCLVAITALHIRRRYDLVYVFSIPNALVLSAAVPRILGARVILDVRDPMPEFFQSKYALADAHPLVRALLVEEAISCRFASRVVTVHEALADVLTRSGRRRSDISVVMNAPDPRVFSGSPAAIRRDPSDRTILYAGTVADRYGVDTLVRALGRLRDDIPALRLRVVGDGDLVPRLRELARAEGVDHRLLFDGPVPLDRVPGIVGECWLGGQPHRTDPLMRFCFSTKVLEWAALGLPVLCARTEAFARAFTDEEFLFVRPGDLDDLCEKIRQADADPEGLAARAARARLSVQRFDWDREKLRLLEAVVVDGP
ncbi:MAG: glycosyltransferase [Actinomycetota bacterium]